MRQSRLLPFLSLGVAALPADTLVFRQQDICSYPFTTGDFAQDTKLWDETGTGSYLADILAKNGAENWSNKFFQQVIADGTQLGSTYDCAAFPSVGKCDGPGTTPCSTYKPPQAFYLHLAMNNLYGTFSTIHEKLQDNAIINLGDTSQELTDKYGPKLDDISVDFFPLAIGAAVFASLVKDIALPAGFLIGALNAAAGVSKNDPAATDPSSFHDSLQQATSKVFGILAKNLEDTVKGLFAPVIVNTGVIHLPTRQVLAGVYSEDAAVKAIMNTFANGVAVDSALLDNIVDTWNTRTASYMKEVALRVAWSKRENPTVVLGIRPGSNIGMGLKMDQGHCESMEGRVWFPDDGCIGYANVEFTSAFTPDAPRYFKDDDLKFAQGYIYDWAGSLGNALDCVKSGTMDDEYGNDVPTTKPNPDFVNVDLNNPVTYYKCFWNLTFTWVNITDDGTGVVR